MSSKKIIITGPPGTGKTTIKKVFFEKANPTKLLEMSLLPTRGFSTSIYSYFNSQIGVFDLAGQENDDWFSKQIGLFKKSDIIICVFDITNTLKQIITFLVDILNVKLKMNLLNCNIIVLLHKIDLVPEDEALNKLKKIKDFLRVKIPESINLEFYLTSITEKFFFRTLKIILEILNKCIKKDLIPINLDEFKNLNTELSILLILENDITYLKSELIRKFKINSNNINFHINRLEKLGLIEIINEPEDNIRLTGRAQHFKRSIFLEIEKVEQIRDRHDLKFFYLLLNLKKIKT
ncbi:MAG: ADP-ribosylation factor-like protein [Promethearchaeota archaeon]